LEMMYETGGSHTAPERKLALVHRVIMPDKDYPKEYAILVTDRRSIFIRQEKTRSSFVLRGEMRYGTAMVTMNKLIWNRWRLMLRILPLRIVQLSHW